MQFPFITPSLAVLNSTGHACILLSVEHNYTAPELMKERIYGQVFC
jgi:hypothetical protein